MSLISVLKTVGKDLKEVGVWIEDGLAVAAPVVGVVDPPLGGLFTAVETVIGALEGPLSVAQVQTVVTDVTALIAKVHGMRSTAPLAPVSGKQPATPA